MDSRQLPCDKNASMSPPSELQTERLLLRRWCEADRAPFAAMNSNPIVMEHFPAMLTTAQSNEFVDRIEDHFDQNGWGLWAAQVMDGAPFIGYVGLWPVSFDAHFTPAVEIGWRLDRPYWGHGYATEAARMVMTDGFARIDLCEIVSMTTTTNLRSQRVMRRLGMHRDPVDDFEHPSIPVGHHLRVHVLYRQPRDTWSGWSNICQGTG